jgi:threonine synthase
MRFYSTNNPSLQVGLEQAVLEGLAPDNGLYMPATIPTLPTGYLHHLAEKSFPEISFDVASLFLSEDIPPGLLHEIVTHTIQFEAPVVKVESNIYSLELFHGPTMAFKDFGARFLSGLLGHFASKQEKEVVILAATSGDTGSAVANGFLDVKGTRVVVLYPKGKVSEIQEKQFTTLGKNITAIEVSGTFDDCQRLVKAAFMDADLKRKLFLTSANSINIGRLLPQTFYYFWLVRQLLHLKEPIMVAVPSGNFGNLAAGLIARKMGLPIHKFVAATNSNDIVPTYLKTGAFEPRPSVATISNAMDVGNPSNFTRIIDLYKNDLVSLKRDVLGCAFSDVETSDVMRAVKAATGYQLDPHGAVGYLGVKKALEQDKGVGVFLETAHPGKFKEVVDQVNKSSLELPDRLQSFLARTKMSIPMESDFASLKEYLLS